MRLGGLGRIDSDAGQAVTASCNLRPFAGGEDFASGVPVDIDVAPVGIASINHPEISKLIGSHVPMRRRHFTAGADDLGPRPAKTTARVIDAIPVAGDVDALRRSGSQRRTRIERN